MKWPCSEKSVAFSISNMETSCNPKKSFKKIINHKYSKGDVIHYSFLTSILMFAFIANPTSILSKFLIFNLLIILFLLPITSQFFWNSLPILTWLALYFTSSYLDNKRRPKITVQVLPAIETILYGDNLSEILATSTNSFLDIFAWLPYGIFHFGAPFFVAVVLFMFGPPTILKGYAFAFGYINLIGVIAQNVFPAAPPWYNISYELKAAHYGMPGSPGGLSRIDSLLGIDLYTSGFENSSVIFGALPSLHSACATIEALFFSYCFPKLRPLFIFYVCWLWWSTMYLTHHYFIDLVLGSVLSLIIFQYTKYNYLPLVDSSLPTRWSYASIEMFDIKKNNPFDIDLNDCERIPHDEIINDNFETSLVLESTGSPSVFDEFLSQSSSTTSIGDVNNSTLLICPKIRKTRYD